MGPQGVCLWGPHRMWGGTWGQAGDPGCGPDLTFADVMWERPKFWGKTLGRRCPGQRTMEVSASPLHVTSRRREGHPMTPRTLRTCEEHPMTPWTLRTCEGHPRTPRTLKRAQSVLLCNKHPPKKLNGEKPRSVTQLLTLWADPLGWAPPVALGSSLSFSWSSSSLSPPQAGWSRAWWRPETLQVRSAP